MKPFDDVLNIKISQSTYPYPHPYPIADMEGSGQDTTACKRYTDSSSRPNPHWLLLDQPTPHSPSSQRINEIHHAPSSDEENDTVDSSSIPDTVNTTAKSHSDPQASTVTHKPATPPTHAPLDAEATAESSALLDQTRPTNDNATATCTVNEDSSRQPLHLRSPSHDRSLSSPIPGETPPNVEEIDNNDDTELSDPDNESNDSENESSIASAAGDESKIPQERLSNSSPRHQESTRDEPPLHDQSNVYSTKQPKDPIVTGNLHHEAPASPSTQESEREDALEGPEYTANSIYTSRPESAEMKISAAGDGGEDENSTFIPWTMDQHRAFVSAVFEIGLKHCSPSVIMDTMKNLPSDMSREKTKSHLQKFRKTSERSLEEFIGEYDDFMKIIQNQDSSSRDEVDHEVKDSQEQDNPETEGLPDKKPTSEEASALLRAALAGKDPDKLLGGTAAAYAAFSVAHNCPITDRSNAIPYEPSPEDFPILNDAESKSSLGQSLIKVKGALEFMTEFILKARHGIPMKLDKKMPPFLKREDVATILPQHFSSNSDGGSDTNPDRGISNHQRPRPVEHGMHGVDPGFSVPYPSHPVYPTHQPPPYMAGYPHNAMGNQHGYGNMPPPSSMYPLGGHHSQNMWQHFIPPTHANQPSFLPPQHEPPTMAPFYPPPPSNSLHPHPPLGVPQDHPFHGHGHHVPYHNGPPGYDYTGGQAALHHARPQHSIHGDFHPSSYMPEQHDLNIDSVHQTQGVPSYPTESLDHQAALSPSNSSKRREKARRYSDDHSPVRRTIFDMATPDKSYSSRRERKEAEKFPQDSRSRSDRSSRHYYEPTMLSSPIHRPTNSSRKRRPWSPRLNEEKQSSKKSRSDIFRIEVPTGRRPEGIGELERPSSTLSFTMDVDDLGLRPTDGTPMSNGAASPVTTVLRDMLWNPLGVDSGDHDHRDRDERMASRSRRNIFSPDRGITTNTPDSRNSLGNEADNRTTNELSTDSPGDQVAMDFGMHVPHPDGEDDCP